MCAPAKLVILGVTTEKTVCDACGKQNLAKTVALQTESGEVLYYGTECAARSQQFGKGAELKKRLGAVEAMQLMNDGTHTEKELWAYVWLNCGQKVFISQASQTVSLYDDSNKLLAQMPAKLTAYGMY
jgi:hypothetical protein